MPELRFAASSRELDAYLALPLSPPPHPGVVVIQDLFGLSDDMRIQADRLAAAGYLALVPSLYSGRGVRCVVSTMLASRSGKGPVYEDIEAARRLLAEREDCSGRVGIIGFCMGGGFALLCAPRGFDAASVNYGAVSGDTLADIGRACPIAASYGARDRSLRGTAAQLEEALTAAGVPHDVKEYPDAGHSFMNRIVAGPLLAPLMHVAGMGYNHAAAEDAWRRILTFFDEHLRGSA